MDNINPDTNDWVNNRRRYGDKAAIGLLFDGSERLPVTHSANGEPRVRIIFNDRDDWTDYAGVAKLDSPNGTIYVAESHVQTRSGELIYIWQLNSATQQIDLIVVDQDGNHIYSFG